MKLTTLYKKNGSKVQQWYIEVLDDKYRTTEGFVDGTLTTSEWTVAKPKNINRSNATSASQQALLEANAKITKKMTKHWYENVTDIPEDEDKRFEPMLAHKYSEHAKKVKYPCFVQPKLDGMRCIVKKDGMWSREGKPIVSSSHIYDNLKHLFDIYPDMIIDGELYNHDYKDNFDAIISLVRKTRPNVDDIAESKDKVQYHVYDVVLARNSKHTFEERITRLKDLENLDSIHLVSTYECFNKEDMDDYYSVWLQDGYEGQMVRNNSPYEEKRSYNLQKRKEFIDAEYNIVDVLEGDGNRSGMLGKFVLDNGMGELFESSARGTFEKFRDILLNKKDYINKSATVRYQNLTPRGVPRFPVVVDTRREDYE